MSQEPITKSKAKKVFG